MRVVIQRVRAARILVQDKPIAQIDHGLLILVGVGIGDGEAEARYLAKKITSLRIFEDEWGKTNLSILDIKGEAIVVSQFTLYANTQKGRRPSFIEAAKPELAEPLIDHFAAILEENGVRTQHGRFGAHMQVELTNDGPMTIWMERESG